MRHLKLLIICAIACFVSFLISKLRIEFGIRILLFVLMGTAIGVIGGRLYRVN